MAWIDYFCQFVQMVVNIQNGLNGISIRGFKQMEVKVMAEKYSKPQITDEMKRQYKEHAAIKYHNATKEALEKEQEKLERGAGIFGWIREQFSSLVNMMKIAALSIFLGRQETAKRLSISSRQDELEKLKAEAWKDASKEVIQKRLAELNKNVKEKSEEQTKGTNLFKQEQSDKKTNDKTKFEQQLHALTEDYREGLKEFLEMQTGINKEYIDIFNVQLNQPCTLDGIRRMTEGSHIHVTFHTMMLDGKENSEYAQGVTINHKGNVLQDNPLARQIGKAILYYTREVYQKEKSERIHSGTQLSKKQWEDLIYDFQQKCILNKSEKRATSICQDYYGHRIELYSVGASRESMCRVVVDRIHEFTAPFTVGDLYDRKMDAPELYKFICDRIHQENYDPNQIVQMSHWLHDYTESTIDTGCYAHYSYQQLTNYFQALLDRDRVDSNCRERTVDFHGQKLEVKWDEKHEISSITLNGREIEITPDIKMDQSFHLQIAQRVAEGMVEKLEEQHRYRGKGHAGVLQQNDFNFDSMRLKDDATKMTMSEQFVEQCNKKLNEIILGNCDEKNIWCLGEDGDSHKIFVHSKLEGEKRSIDMIFVDGAVVYQMKDGKLPTEEITKLITEEFMKRGIFEEREDLHYPDPYVQDRQELPELPLGSFGEEREEYSAHE